MVNRNPKYAQGRLRLLQNVPGMMASKHGLQTMDSGTASPLSVIGTQRTAAAGRR